MYDTACHDSSCSLALGPDASSWLPRTFIGDFNNFMFHDVSFSRPYKDLHISQGTYGHFQMMFGIIAPLLMTGAYAERLSFKAFLMFTALWEFFVYAPSRAHSNFVFTYKHAAVTIPSPTGFGALTAGFTFWVLKTSPAGLSSMSPLQSAGL